MIFWIIVVVTVLALIIAWINISFDSYYGFGSYVGSFFGILGIGVIGGLGLIMPFAAMFAPTDASYAAVKPLKAMANHSSVEGSFFLVFGQVGEKVQINYITQDTEGGFKISSADPKSVRIFEDNTGPALHIGSRVHSAWWLAPWPWLSWETPSMDFHVPPGTIIQEYSIDISK